MVIIDAKRLFEIKYEINKLLRDYPQFEYLRKDFEALFKVNNRTASEELMKELARFKAQLLKKICLSIGIL